METVGFPSSSIILLVFADCVNGTDGGCGGGGGCLSEFVDEVEGKE